MWASGRGWNSIGEPTRGPGREPAYRSKGGRPRRAQVVVSTSFYSREQFYEIYGGGEYARLKARYDPQGRFAGLYEKTCLEGSMKIAEAFDQLAGPDADVEFVAYDGSKGGRLGSDVRLEVKSPKAIAALLGAPGQLVWRVLTSLAIWR